MSKKYRMSSAQKRMYIIDQMQGDNVTYNVPIIMNVEGSLDINHLNKALNQLSERHELLRTHFQQKNDNFIQVVEDSVEIHAEYEENSNVDIQNEMKTFLKPFDLARAPLMRVKVINTLKGNSILMIDIHHIIFDGWSTNILFHDLSSFYNGEQLPELELQYKDYSAWQNSKDLHMQAEYWLKEFSGEVPTLNLITDYPRPAQKTYNGNTIITKLSAQVKNKLKTMGDTVDATDYMILLSAAMLLFHKYSRQDEIVVGSPIAGRVHPDTQAMMGMFVNTLAIKANVDSNLRFVELLEQIKEKCLNAYENQEYPFEDLVDKLDLERDLSRNPIFDIMFVLQNNENNRFTLNDSLMKPIDFEYKIAKFDITISIEEVNDEYLIKWEYCTDLFSEKTIERMGKHFIELILNIIDNPMEVVSRINMITDSECDYIMNNFNNTNTDFPEESTIIELFEEQVLKDSEAIAVVADNQRLTYKELNEKSEKLAAKLRLMGIKPDDFVGIITERRNETIIGLLGILKAGGAYMPIDPKYPLDRIHYLIKDSKARTVLASGRLKYNFGEAEIKIIDLLDDNLYKGEMVHLDKVNTPCDLAYLIYTSGTTGNPKGVMIEHRSVNRLVRDTNYVEFDNIKILQTGSLAFDASTFEIWGALLNGGCVCIAEDEVLSSANLLRQTIINDDINTMYMTTALYNQMIRIDNKIFDSLSRLLFGGEAASEEHVRMLINRNSKIKLSNVYGPTESTTFASYFPIHGIRRKTPIGKPISNTQIYVMNHNLLCGVGVPGELCIGGAGLARGYLNRPELTEEKFIKNPFMKEERLYKSGDLVRLLEDGNIEYLGRLDEQVKLRGFRIELGEIESRLREIDGINDVVVIVAGDKEDKYLCSFIVSDMACDITGIREYLSKYLPEYMIPEQIIQINKFPLTKNGKLNKKELPVPALKSNRTYAAPRNETEAYITEVFEEVLNVQNIGIDDSFFELGGHSLRATKLVNMIEFKWGIRIPLRDVLAAKTVRNLAKAVQDRQCTENTTELLQPVQIKRIPKQNSYKTSSTQKRIYLIDQIQDRNVTYNIPLAFRIKGELNDEILKKSFNKLVERHEILRTRFDLKDGNPIQIIEENIEVQLDIITDTNSAIQEILKRLIQPFDLSRAPLLRTWIVRNGDQDGYLLIDVHHIIFDGESIPALFKELNELYNGAVLEPLNIQYKDFTAWQNAIDLRSQEQYWLDEFSGEIPSLNLFTDYSRPNERSFNGAVLSSEISKYEMNSIESFSALHGATEYITVLSAVMIFLYKYSRQNEIIIGSPIAGRMTKDTQNMIGMFVNTLGIKGNIDSKMSFVEFVDQIKEKCFKAYENQDYPFDELIEKLEVERNSSKNPLFDVMFAFQNKVDSVFRLGESELLPLQYVGNISKFDLTITMEKSKDGYRFDWEYCTDLYKKETIEQMSRHFAELLKNALNNPEQKIEAIEVLSAQEKEKVLYTFNNTKTEYPDNVTMVELFEEQVRNNPDNMAVISDNQTMTYDEINKKSNRLALTLREMGVIPNSFVGIIANRQMETIVGILGILKAGGAYLPIDPKYPISRIQFIIKDSDTKIILVDNHNSLNINSREVKLIDITENIFYAEDDENLVPVNKFDDFAYMIYTSGTTGEPKGAMILHRSVNRMVKNTNYANFNNIKILQTGSLAFDASVFEIWGALLNGGYLCIAKEEVLSSEILLKQTLLNNNINTMFMTSALFNQMISIDKEIFDSLEHLLIGGDAVSDRHVRMLTDRNSKIRFTNGYGPTENTTFTTFYDIGDNAKGEKTPIGKPVSNTQVYIMNNNELCGIGMPGEIHIGGDGLSGGYFNRPELTSQKFVENPYHKGEIIYKSGDLARWREDGNIEFLGRIDKQVKIRGFRIEIEEIENNLKNITGISDAVVVPYECDGDKSLSGYIIAKHNLQVEYIKDVLSKSLPDYMIPSYITKLEKFPLNKNGKIDRNKLPKPEVKGLKEFAAPRNRIENCIYDVFKEILGVETFGIDDSFFDLGGDSIKAIRIVSKIREYGYDLNVRNIMQYKSVRLIAAKIDDSKALVIDQAEIAGVVEMTPIQREFFAYHLAEPNHFNQSMMLESKERIDSDNLKIILTEIVKHHDQLRAVFNNGGQQIEAIESSALFELSYYDYRDISQKDKLFQKINVTSEQIQSSIDISRGPLLKAGLFKAKDQDYLLLCIHHLVVDGVSWRIILEDLSKGYSNLKTFNEVIMPNKTVSYQKWSESLWKYGNTDEVQNEIDYWMGIEQKIIESTNLILKNVLGDKVNEENIDFNEDETFKLLYQAGRAYDTQINELLLTALFRAINKVTDNKTVSIHMEGHGREFIDKKVIIDRTVGWFTSIYPVAVEGVGGSLQRDINNVKETLRKIPNHGIGYGILKNLVNNQLRGVEPDITFNYLGEFGDESASGVFKLSTIAHGRDFSKKNKFGTEISINGAVMNKRLRLTISYNEGLYINAFIGRLKNEYKVQLLRLIAHCIDIRNDEKSNNTDGQSHGSDLVQNVWSQFGIDSIMKEIQVNENFYRILFVENLDIRQRTNIMNQIMEGLSIEDTPQYLVDMNRYKYAASTMDEDAFRKMCNDSDSGEDIKRFRLAISKYKEFTEIDVVEEYLAPAMQKSFLKMTSQVIVNEKIVIEGLYSENLIVEGIRQIIKNNDVLRTSYQIINGEYMVFEHLYTKNWDIPYVNISYNTCEDKKAIYDMIENKSLWKYRNGEKNNLSNIVVTKESEVRHVIHIVASHAVWDKTSTQIFQEELESIIKSEQIEQKENNKQYKEYVQEIIENQEDQKVVNQEFINSANIFVENNADKKLIRTESALIKMGKHTSNLYKENPWGVLPYILNIIMKSNNLISKDMNSYPALILQEDRRYMNKDYTNTLGAFLDAIPIIVPCNQDIIDSNIEREIKNYQITKQKTHINLLNDLMTQDTCITIEKLPLINYHGIFDLSFEALQKTINLLEKQKNQIGYCEIYINNYMDYLSVAFPVFDQSGENVSQKIQMGIDMFEENLVDSNHYIIDEVNKVI